MHTENSVKTISCICAKTCGFLSLGELGSSTRRFEAVLKISMCRFSLIFQGFSGFWITVAPFINTENEGIIRPFSVIECCIYHTRKLFRLIILYFRINVHRRFAVLMSSQILNCFRINPCIKKIGYVCMYVATDGASLQNPDCKQSWDCSFDVLLKLV